MAPSRLRSGDGTRKSACFHPFVPLNWLHVAFLGLSGSQTYWVVGFPLRKLAPKSRPVDVNMWPVGPKGQCEDLPFASVRSRGGTSSPAGRRSSLGLSAQARSYRARSGAVSG